MHWGFQDKNELSMIASFLIIARKIYVLVIVCEVNEE